MMAKINAKLPEVKDRKVILLGIDGVQLSKMKALHTPNFDRLKVTKA